jgi:hypothetical protein
VTVSAAGAEDEQHLAAEHTSMEDTSRPSRRSRRLRALATWSSRGSSRASRRPA